LVSDFLFGLFSDLVLHYAGSVWIGITHIAVVPSQSLFMLGFFFLSPSVFVQAGTSA
jgi:hypothetical protein